MFEMKLEVFQNACKEYSEWKKTHQPWDSFDAGVMTYIEEMLYTAAAAEERGDFGRVKEYYKIIQSLLDTCQALVLSYDDSEYSFDINDDEEIKMRLDVEYRDYEYYYMHPYTANCPESINFKPKDYQGIALNKAARIVDKLINKSNSEEDIAKYR